MVNFDLEITYCEKRVLESALEALYQIDGLGFTEQERDIALNLLEKVQGVVDEL